MIMPASDSPAAKSPKRARAAQASGEMLSPTVLYSAGSGEGSPRVYDGAAGGSHQRRHRGAVEGGFFRPGAPGNFWRLSARCTTRAQAIDVMTIHQWLTDRKLAEAVGSPGILAELLVGFATHLNVGSYIQIVKEKSLLRCLQIGLLHHCRRTSPICPTPSPPCSIVPRSAIFHVTNLGLTQIDRLRARGNRQGDQAHREISRVARAISRACRPVFTSSTNSPPAGSRAK